MGDPTGETNDGALGLDFDRRLKLQFRGSAITSDAGLLAYRELDDVLALTTIGGERLADARTGKNSRHLLVGLLRQSVFGRLAGYEDVNDAERLRRDPAMRWVVGDRAITGSAASASQMGPLHESALSVRHLGRSMNGLRAGMSAPPVIAAARVAAGVTSLTCQEPTFTGPLPNRRSPRRGWAQRGDANVSVADRVQLRPAAWARFCWCASGGGVTSARDSVGAIRFQRWRGIGTTGFRHCCALAGAFRSNCAATPTGLGAWCSRICNRVGSSILGVRPTCGCGLEGIAARFQTPS
jgi:hypothetical protein